MDAKILSLIELAVESGEITDKQRQLIIKKACESGIEEEEVNIYIDSKLSQVKNEGSQKESNKLTETATIKSADYSLDDKYDYEESRKLTKIKAGKVLFGVCAGIGKYYHISPIGLRILAVVFSGIAIYPYIIMAFVLPSSDK